MLELPTFHSEETASSLFASTDICRAMRLFFGQHSCNSCDEVIRRSLTFNSFLKRYSYCFGSCGCRFDERRMQFRASIAASGKDQPTNQPTNQQTSLSQAFNPQPSSKSHFDSVGILLVVQNRACDGSSSATGFSGPLGNSWPLHLPHYRSGRDETDSKNFTKSAIIQRIESVRKRKQGASHMSYKEKGARIRVQMIECGQF